MDSLNKGMTNRIESLQGLRFLAFFGIFISHIGIMPWGAWGVSVFLVLSGFLMTYRYSQSDIPAGIKKRLTFSVNKVKKLYPLHVITMICALAIQIYRKKIFYSFFRSIIDAGIVVLHLLLLQPWIPRSGVYFSLNGVSWYLGVSLLCYLLFPAVIKKIQRYRSKKDAIKWMILIFLIQIVVAFGSTFVHVPEYISKDFTKWVTYVFPLFRFGDFAIGCNLGYLFINRKEAIVDENITPIWTLTEMGSLIVALLIPIDMLQNSKWAWATYSLIYLPLSVLLIYSVASQKGLFSRFLGRRLTVLGGDLSQYAFLIHTVVIAYFSGFRPENVTGNMGKCLSCIILLSITLLFSWIWKQGTHVLKTRENR